MVAIKGITVMIAAYILFITLVVGLTILGGGIPKSATNRSHLQIKVDDIHFGCVDRRDRGNPTKSLLAVAIEDTLRAQGIQPLYIIAGLSEVRVALKDRTLIYHTTPLAAGYLKAYRSFKPISGFTTTLKLVEVKHDGIPPLRRILNLLPV